MPAASGSRKPSPKRTIAPEDVLLSTCRRSGIALASDVTVRGEGPWPIFTGFSLSRATLPISSSPSFLGAWSKIASWGEISEQHLLARLLSVERTVQSLRGRSGYFLPSHFVKKQFVGIVLVPPESVERLERRLQRVAQSSLCYL